MQTMCHGVTLSLTLTLSRAQIERGLFIEEKHTDFVRDSAYMVHTQNLLIMLHLWVAINVGVRQGRHPVSQDCRIAPLYQDPQSPPEVPDCLTLLLASVTGQGSPQIRSADEYQMSRRCLLAIPTHVSRLPKHCRGERSGDG